MCMVSGSTTNGHRPEFCTTVLSAAQGRGADSVTRVESETENLLPGIEFAWLTLYFQLLT